MYYVSFFVLNIVFQCHILKAIISSARSANSYSHPEVRVRSLVERNMWFGVGEGAHDLLHFVLGHLVFSQGDIVTEQSSAKLISDEYGQDRSPSDAKDHVE